MGNIISNWCVPLVARRMWANPRRWHASERMVISRLQRGAFWWHFSITCAQWAGNTWLNRFKRGWHAHVRGFYPKRSLLYKCRPGVFAYFRLLRVNKHVINMLLDDLWQYSVIAHPFHVPTVNSQNFEESIVSCSCLAYYLKDWKICCVKVVVVGCQDNESISHISFLPSDYFYKLRRQVGEKSKRISFS